jgi:hypothetical protein
MTDQPSSDVAPEEGKAAKRPWILPAIEVIRAEEAEGTPNPLSVDGATAVS